MAHVPGAGQGLVGDTASAPVPRPCSPGMSPGRRFVPGATALDAVQSPYILWGGSPCLQRALGPSLSVLLCEVFS